MIRQYLQDVYSSHLVKKKVNKLVFISFQAVYAQFVLLCVQYASPQYNYNGNYNGNYNDNYNNPGYYQNQLQNYGYQYPSPQTENDLSEEDTTEYLLSVEIRRSSKHRKRDKKKKNKKHKNKNKKKSKHKTTAKDCYECDNSCDSPECKSQESGRSTECRECNCQECTINDVNQDSCCPLSCQQCTGPPPPPSGGMAVMAYPISFLMPQIPNPMPYTPDDFTSDPYDPTNTTTENPDTTESEQTETTDITTKPITRHITTTVIPTDSTIVPTTHSTTDPTTDRTTDHTTDSTTHPTTDPTTDPTKDSRTDPTTDVTGRITATDITKSTPSSSSTPRYLSTPPYFPYFIRPEVTTTTFTATTSFELFHQPIRMEKYLQPSIHDIELSSHKGNEIRPINYWRNYTTDDDDQNMKIMINDRNRYYYMLTQPPSRMVLRPNRDFVDEIESKKNNKRRYETMRQPRLGRLPLEHLRLGYLRLERPRLERPRLEQLRLEQLRLEHPRLEHPRLEQPHYPTKHANVHKMPKYGLLTIPDKLTSKLLFKLRTMKDLNTKEKNTPLFRKLKVAN